MRRALHGNRKIRVKFGCGPFIATQKLDYLSFLFDIWRINQELLSMRKIFGVRRLIASQTITQLRILFRQSFRTIDQRFWRRETGSTR